jgi:hypothetical protein
VNSLLCYRKQRNFLCSDTNPCAAALASTSAHRIFSSLLARRTLRLFYFPIGKSAPTENLHRIPSSHSGDRTSRLREVSGRTLYSRIVETRQLVNADLSLLLSGFLLSRFHHSQCQETCFTDSRTPIRRNSNARAS